MNFEEFITSLKDNQELTGKMSNAVSPEASYEIAKEAGFAGSFEEFVKGMQDLNEAATQMDASDVDAVAGGASTTEIVSAVASTVGSAASAAAAAAT